MAADNGLPSVQHIVVLMLENRSFDHMLLPSIGTGAAYDGYIRAYARPPAG